MAANVIDRYQKQRSRGTKGFGFYIPAMNRLAHNTREERILRLLGRAQASEILYHHRWPTSTENVRNACHPFSTKSAFKKNYVMVHNGVVSNDDELAEEHKERGIKYISTQPDGRFNDSEALLYDIALYLEGEHSTLKAEGDIAFIVIENAEDGSPSKLHFGRNEGSPLFMHLDDSFISLASEASAEHKAQSIEAHKLYTLDYATRLLTIVDLEIPEWMTFATKNTFNHGYWGKDGQWVSDYPDYDHYDRPAMGFRTYLDTKEPQETKYYDSETQMYLPSADIKYGSPGYEAMTREKGEELAFEILAELGDVGEAIMAVKDRQDSLDGKIARLNDQALRMKAGTRKFNKLSKERLKFWREGDVLDEALLVLDDATTYDGSDDSFIEGVGGGEVSLIAQVNAAIAEADEREAINILGEG